MTQPSQPKKEVEFLSNRERWAGLFTVALMMLLLAFFIYHQWKGTGFFTDQFKIPEMLALYGPIIISVGPHLQRLVQGRRNLARPLEATSDVLLAVGSIWLWNHFPFDFTHLADPFPPAMRFAFAWITNDIGRLILLLQVIIGFISSAAIIVSYLQARKAMEHKD